MVNVDSSCRCPAPRNAQVKRAAGCDKVSGIQQPGSSAWGLLLVGARQKSRGQAGSEQPGLSGQARAAAQVGREHVAISLLWTEAVLLRLPSSRAGCISSGVCIVCTCAVAAAYARCCKPVGACRDQTVYSKVYASCAWRLHLALGRCAWLVHGASCAWRVHLALGGCTLRLAGAWCILRLVGALGWCMVHLALGGCILCLAGAWCILRLAGALGWCMEHLVLGWCILRLAGAPCAWRVHLALGGCMVHLALGTHTRVCLCGGV